MEAGSIEQLSEAEEDRMVTVEGGGASNSA